MRDGHQVAQRVGVIEHDEGLGVLCHGRAEGSPTLALARLGIDPLLVKDALGDTQDLRREAPESVLHDLTSLDVRHRTPLAKRRVLIGKMQLLEPHQFGLLRKPTLRHAIARLNCLHHRVDPRRLELVRKVPRRDRRVVTAQSIHRQTISDNAVVAGRKYVAVRLERHVQRLESGQPYWAIGGVDV